MTAANQTARVDRAAVEALIAAYQGQGGEATAVAVATLYRQLQATPAHGQTYAQAEILAWHQGDEFIILRSTDPDLVAGLVIAGGKLIEAKGNQERGERLAKAGVDLVHFVQVKNGKGGGALKVMPVTAVGDLPVDDPTGSWRCRWAGVPFPPTPLYSELVGAVQAAWRAIPLQHRPIVAIEEWSELEGWVPVRVFDSEVRV